MNYFLLFSAEVDFVFFSSEYILEVCSFDFQVPSVYSGGFQNIFLPSCLKTSVFKYNGASNFVLFLNLRLHFKLEQQSWSISRSIISFKVSVFIHLCVFIAFSSQSLLSLSFTTLIDIAFNSYGLRWLRFLFIWIEVKHFYCYSAEYSKFCRGSFFYCLRAF